MAITAFEILGVLKLDKSDFEKGLDGAKSSAKGLAGAMGTGLATAAKVGMSAVGAATTAAVGFGKSAVSAATSFESAFTGVRKTVDATEDEYNQLSDWIKDSSTKMASSQEEIAGTMEIAGQLGIRGVDGLKKFTETMIMLGDTTNLNAEEAAGALARFGNIAGLKAEDMDRIGSVIVDLGNHFATTEADIVNMSTRLASAGTVAGLSATDILALSTAMSSVGIQAEAGGTAMAQTLAKMSKAVDGGGEALEQYARVAGMSAEDFAATWKGKPIDAVTAFITGLKNVKESDESVIQTLEDLGLKGIRQTNMLQALALASDMMGSSVNMANEAFEENVALQNEANLRYGTTESQAIQTANAFKNLRIAIGEELKPAYGDLMAFAGTALESMQKGFEEGGLNGLMGSLGDALSDGLNIVFEKLPGFVEAGLQLIGALAEGIGENSEQIINTAFEILDLLVSSIGTYLSEHSEEIVSGLGSISELLLSKASELMWSFADALAGVDFGQAATDVSDKILELFDPENGMITGLLYAAARIVENLGSGLVDAAPTLVTTAYDLIANLCEFLMQEGPELINTAVDLVISLAEGLTDPDSLSNLLNSALDMILSLAQGLIDNIPKLTAAIPTIIDNLLKTIVEFAPRLLAGAVQLIIQLQIGLIKNLPTLLRAVPQIIGSLVSYFISMGPKLLQSGADLIKKFKDGILSLNPIQWGKDLISNFVDGIKKGWGELKGALGELGDKISDYIGFSEPKLGPLSNFHTYAPDMMELFAEGVRDNTDLVTDQLQKSFDFSDVIVDQNINANGVSSGTGAPITVNVYGAEGQDVNALADAVSDRLQHLYDRGVAAYA